MVSTRSGSNYTHRKLIPILGNRIRRFSGGGGLWTVTFDFQLNILLDIDDLMS